MNLKDASPKVIGNLRDSPGAEVERCSEWHYTNPAPRSDAVSSQSRDNVISSSTQHVKQIDSSPEELTLTKILSLRLWGF